MAQETQTGALYQPRGLGWGERFRREGIYIYLWLIHVEVRQKTTKFCKAMILQLKKLIKFKKEKKNFWAQEKDKKTISSISTVWSEFEFW